MVMYRRGLLLLLLYRRESIARRWRWRRTWTLLLRSVLRKLPGQISVNVEVVRVSLTQLLPYGVEFIPEHLVLFLESPREFRLGTHSH
jgi:hypothetical protein